MKKHFTDVEERVLNSFEKQTKKDIINLFELAEIEDRYTEKDIMINACVAIKELLNEIHKC